MGLQGESWGKARPLQSGVPKSEDPRTRESPMGKPQHGRRLDRVSGVALVTRALPSLQPGVWPPSWGAGRSGLSWGRVLGGAVGGGPLLRDWVLEAPRLSWGAAVLGQPLGCGCRVWAGPHPSWVFCQRGSRAPGAAGPGCGAGGHGPGGLSGSGSWEEGAAGGESLCGQSQCLSGCRCWCWGSQAGGTS